MKKIILAVLLAIGVGFVFNTSVARPPAPPPPTYTYTFSAQDACETYPHPVTSVIGPGDGWLAVNGGTPPTTLSIAYGDLIRIGFAGCSDVDHHWLAGHVTRYTNGQADSAIDLILPPYAGSGVWQLRTSGTQFWVTLESWEPVQD